METPPKSNRSLRTLELTPGHGEMIKPAELIDISGAANLSLSARRVYNKLVAWAFSPEMGEPGHEWTIGLSELRGAHKGTERLEDCIVALMRTIVSVRLSDGRTRRVALLGGNDLADEDRPRGTLTYSFDKRLVVLLRNSTVFGKLELKVMMAFSTKYALALYEAITRRVRLKYTFCEEWSLDELRDVLGVSEGKLTTYGNLNKVAIRPALREINAMAAFGVRMTPVKQGRKVVGVSVGWWQKDVEGMKEAYAEVERPRVGRKARIAGEVEEISSFPCPEASESR